MKFTQQRPDGVNLIRRYGPDFVTIGEQEMRASCIVSATTIDAWPPHSVAELTVEHCAALFARNPEIVVLSTGARQQFPRAALRAEFASRKIGLEIMEVGAACRTYNVLAGEERKVLAAILIA